MTEKNQKLIANNLRRIRNDKGMTQLQVAEKAGISTNHYALIERAEYKPTVETLEKILKALGAKSRDVLPF